MENNDAVKE
jgi:hypothetical protein